MQLFTLFAALTPAFISMGFMYRNVIRNGSIYAFLGHATIAVVLTLAGMAAHAAFWQIGALFHS
jgi:hypothetical protein